MARVKRTSSKRAPCWTAEEDAALREGYRQKLPLRSIAAQLGRTVTAVRRRVVRLRAARAEIGRIREYWDPESDETLRELHASGVPVRKIANHMGRTSRAVRERMGRLGMRGPEYRRRHGLPTTKMWGPEDDEFLTFLYTDGYRIQKIATRLGRTYAATASRVKTLGLVRAHGWHHANTDVERVKLLHAAGMPNGDIAREMGDAFSRKDPKKQIRLLLKQCGLTPHRYPTESAVAARREACARKWRSHAETCERFAAMYGLPKDLVPHQVQMVALLSGGPMTLPQLARAMGIKRNSMRACGASLSFAGDLARRGLVAYVPGGRPPGQIGRGGNTPRTYFLTARAMEMLATAGKGGAA